MEGMEEKSLFISSLSRRELARRRPNRSLAPVPIPVILLVLAMAVIGVSLGLSGSL